jgi:hypothetical protein
MPFHLNATANGSTVLEFDEDDIPAVAARINAEWGVPGKDARIGMTTYHIEGCEITFYNEWGDPCLMSSSAEGGRVLEHLFTALSKHDRV